MIERVISGGQTGADRAGLDFAMASGIPHGGWCPRGRRAEDGPIPPEYNLKETRETDYRERTRKNLEEADGTIIFTDGPMSSESGSSLTMRLCVKLGKPHMVVDLSGWSVGDAAKFVRTFINRDDIKVLNVAGSRASISPEIAGKVREVLRRAFFEREAP